MTNTATTAVPAAHDHAPAGEHEVRETITLDFYYPDHPPRTESAVFRATVTAGKAKGETCAVCGVDDPEYHHFFIEWADANAVRWSLVKAVAMGEMASPTAALTWIIELARVRGFGWAAFDPTKPE